MLNLGNEGNDIFRLEIDEEAKSNLLEMSRWTKFLSIIGFIFIGLIIVAGILFGVMISTLYSNMGSNLFAGMGTTGIIILYVVIGAIYFYPTYALLKYSTNMKAALNTADKARFNTAIYHLKNVFKYIGILLIIILVLYGVVIIFALIAAATRI